MALRIHHIHRRNIRCPTSKHSLDYQEEKGSNQGGKDTHNLPLIRYHLSAQFLTFPPQGQEETYVWAIISDKQNTIPVKFTREAMTDYYQTRRVQCTTSST